MLLATTAELQVGRRQLPYLETGEENKEPKGDKERPQLGENQCAHCKKEGPWDKECPQKTARGNIKVLSQRDVDSN